MISCRVGDIDAAPTADTVAPVRPAPDPKYRPTRAARFGSTATVRRLVGGVVLTGALLVAGCGGDNGPSTAADDGPTAASDRSGGGAPLDGETAAEIDLMVVADGSQVALADVAASDRSTLLWFWAPF